MKAPFPYFGGKRTVAPEVWRRFGSPKQYIEPFCGSAAILLAAPAPASLEVIGDMNGFIANFWRAVVHQHAEVARWADYPVSHVDLHARHAWLMERRQALAAGLEDPEWTGNAQAAGWWLWGQCCWIGSGWCEWDRDRQRGHGDSGSGQGQVPHVGNAGMGIQAAGKVPHVSDGGRGAPWTSSGAVAMTWLAKLSARMERVRVVHGDWKRCLNHHYGGNNTAVFLDPPYEGYEGLYGARPIAADVADWCRENSGLKIALCGHRGDYQLEGWSVFEWERERNTYGGDSTKGDEAIWFSPSCAQGGGQLELCA